MKPFHRILADEHRGHCGQAKLRFAQVAQAKSPDHIEAEPQRHRRFHRGELKGLILHLLSQGAAHGYELIKAIGDQVGDGYQPSPGVIYPTLNALETAHLICAEGDDNTQDGRKVYVLTDAGKAHLAKHAEQLSVLLQRLERQALRQRARNNPQINAALQQLKAALRRKFANDDLAEPVATAIAHIIEQAAQEIEKH